MLRRIRRRKQRVRIYSDGVRESGTWQSGYDVVVFRIVL